MGTTDTCIMFIPQSTLQWKKKTFISIFTDGNISLNSMFYHHTAYNTQQFKRLTNISIPLLCKIWVLVLNT